MDQNLNGLVDGGDRFYYSGVNLQAGTTVNINIGLTATYDVGNDISMTLTDYLKQKLK